MHEIHSHPGMQHKHGIPMDHIIVDLEAFNRCKKLDKIYINNEKGETMIEEKDFKEIMKVFDFERVRKAMDAVNWNYTGDPVTVEELRNMAWTLYNGFGDWDHKAYCSTSSGGFTVRKPYDAKYLVLSFHIENVSNQHESEVRDV